MTTHEAQRQFRRIVQQAALDLMTVCPQFTPFLLVHTLMSMAREALWSIGGQPEAR
jgi:hypothetical protein